MKKRVKTKRLTLKKSVIKRGKSKKLFPENKQKKVVHPSTTKRVPLGIPNFDRLVEGGLEKKSINLVIGGSGSAKTIFAIQFIYQGLLKGEHCLYVTFEEKKEEFYANMLEFGWDLEKFEKEDKFVFLEYTPEKVKTMLEEGGGIIESIVLQKKISRVVIDSITSFALLFDSELEKREASLSLFTMLRKWECTTLLTYQRDPVNDKKLASGVIEFESDSIIILYFMRTKKTRERYLEILKMRGTKHATEIYPFILTKKGIYVQPHPCNTSLDLDTASS